MAYTLIQKVGDQSPGSATFSMQSQQATEVYYVIPSEMEEAVADILGSTKPAGDGSLDRVLPKCHPQWTHLYASNVEVIGVGMDDPTGEAAALVDAESGLEAEPIVSQYWQYALIQIRVTFTPRPYAVLSNDSIDVTNTTSYYTPSNTLVSNTIVATEWLRYVDILYSPSPEMAFASQGLSRFYTGTGSKPGGNPGFAFGGFPRMVIPKAAIELQWYEIPDIYLFSNNSYLVDFVGRVNQSDWFGWDAGTLLYMGVKVTRRYTPPFPEKVVAPGGGAAFDHSKLLDLSLSLEEAVRSQADVPTFGAGNTNTTIANRSYIAGGHNLQPFLGGVTNTGNTTVAVTRGFYYAGTDNSDKTPTFDSAPFSLLFTDPDV